MHSGPFICGSTPSTTEGCIASLAAAAAAALQVQPGPTQVSHNCAGLGQATNRTPYGLRALLRGCSPPLGCSRPLPSLGCQAGGQHDLHCLNHILCGQRLLQQSGADCSTLCRKPAHALKLPTHQSPTPSTPSPLGKASNQGPEWGHMAPAAGNNSLDS